MSDRGPALQPPIFNLQAYSPAEIKEAVEKVGVKKANLPFLASFMLAIIGGGSVGFGALYYTIVASDAELSFATVRVVGGLVFSLGLALVLVGGAELFTGNNLIVMAWASGKVPTRTMLRNCDRADLDYIRVFVGKASVVGIPLASLPMPSGYPAHLLHVRRYDADLVPSPDLMLEFGDRVGVLTPPDRKEEMRRHFGDTVKAAAEFSYVSLGLGMVLGVLLGLVPIPIPGVGIVTLGIGGGPLIVALILGKLRRTGPMLWTMPLPANIVLRNFGLAMFLATVGVNAGQPFVRTVAESGFTMLFIGVAVLLTTVFIVLLVGHYVLKIPYDDLVGVASGATGNPAILVYSTKMAPTERPDIGYAMIFPSMTLVKVIAAQIVGLMATSGAGG